MTQSTHGNTLVLDVGIKGQLQLLGLIIDTSVPSNLSDNKGRGEGVLRLPRVLRLGRDVLACKPIDTRNQVSKPCQ